MARHKLYRKKELTLEAFVRGSGYIPEFHEAVVIDIEERPDSCIFQMDDFGHGDPDDYDMGLDMDTNRDGDGDGGWHNSNQLREVSHVPWFPEGIGDDEPDINAAYGYHDGEGRDK